MGPFRIGLLVDRPVRYSNEYLVINLEEVARSIYQSFVARNYPGDDCTRNEAILFGGGWTVSTHTTRTHSWSGTVGSLSKRVTGRPLGPPVNAVPPKKLLFDGAGQRVESVEGTMHPRLLAGRPKQCPSLA